MREPTPSAEATPTPAVTCELKINGRKVKDFPHRLLNEQRDLPPEKAKRLIDLWQELTRPG